MADYGEARVNEGLLSHTIGRVAAYGEARVKEGLLSHTIGRSGSLW